MIIAGITCQLSLISHLWRPYPHLSPTSESASRHSVCTHVWHQMHRRSLSPGPVPAGSSQRAHKLSSGRLPGTNLGGSIE